jgi:DNA-binding transcriptional regulator GbsR (MarR family)
MKDYDKLLKDINIIERDYFALWYNTKTEAQVTNKNNYDKRFDIVLDNIRKLRDNIQELVDDQLKEIKSMTKEYEQITKLNKKLGELLNDK